MTLNSFSSGVNTSFSSQLNQNFNVGKLQTAYTGSGFNISSTAALTTAAYTYSISSAYIPTKADVLVFRLSYHCHVKASGTAGDNTLTGSLQLAETGSSFTTWFENYFGFVRNVASNTDYSNTVASLDIPRTLTANDKINGVDLKILLTASISAGSGTMTFTNLGISVYTYGQ